MHYVLLYRHPDDLQNVIIMSILTIENTFWRDRYVVSHHHHPHLFQDYTHPLEMWLPSYLRRKGGGVALMTYHMNVSPVFQLTPGNVGAYSYSRAAECLIPAPGWFLAKCRCMGRLTNTRSEKG